jgi:hypothetical protein
MAFIMRSQAVERARRATLTKTASAIFEARLDATKSPERRDVFLSHSFADRELILGIALILEDLRHSVYLDWRDDPELSRERVTPQTASVLRERMQRCRCLLFATSPNSPDSKWMPWELGYMDGHNGKAAILPILDRPGESVSGQEYLGVYPDADVAKTKGGVMKVWINRGGQSVALDDWLKA